MGYSVNGLICCLLLVTPLYPSIRIRGTNRRTSSFAANSYLPTIPILTTDFHKSAELMNLTVTVYMVFQAICMCRELC